MRTDRDTWLTLAVAVSYIAAVVLATLTVLLTAGLVREYGAAEGYADLLWQTLPITLVGLGLAALFVWVGRHLGRRRSRAR